VYAASASTTGVLTPAPHTSAWAYLRHLLVCARSERFSPLVEHVLRATGSPLDPGGRIPSVFLEPGTPSRWQWLARRLLDPEGRQQRPIAQQHPVGASRPPTPSLPWGEAANLQANAYRERIVASWAPAELPYVLGYARATDEQEIVRQDRAELPAVLRFDPLPTLARGWYLVRVDVREPSVDRVAVLVHELAHVLLGHIPRPLGASPSRSVQSHRPGLGRCTKEVEAASVAFIVTRRRGLRTPFERSYLRDYFEAARHAGLLETVDLICVFRAAETLLAWCRSDHDRMGVLDPRRPTPAPAPFPLVGARERLRALIVSAEREALAPAIGFGAGPAPVVAAPPAPSASPLDVRADRALDRALTQGRDLAHDRDRDGQAPGVGELELGILDVAWERERGSRYDGGPPLRVGGVVERRRDGIAGVGLADDDPGAAVAAGVDRRTRPRCVWQEERARSHHLPEAFAAQETPSARRSGAEVGRGIEGDQHVLAQGAEPGETVAGASRHLRVSVPAGAQRRGMHDDHEVAVRRRELQDLAGVLGEVDGRAGWERGHRAPPFGVRSS
jgi:hypothetical protein